MTTETVSKIPVTSILVHRVEGPTYECRPQTFDSYVTARAALGQMALTAPARGGYSKTDFTVTFADGETYCGRIDLERQHVGGYDVKRHVHDWLTFLASRDSDAQARFERDQALEFLAKYDV